MASGRASPRSWGGKTLRKPLPLGWAPLCLLPTTPAAAQTFSPLAEARLRYEHVEQAPLAKDADAVTARVRAGFRLDDGRWSALVEAQGLLAIDPHYFDGVRGDPARPLVADPQNIDLRRAQLRYAVKPFAVTAGRQVIELADQRFVGSSPFRQNGQTYDAVRGEWHGLPGVTLDLSYAWRVHTVNGAFGAGARPATIRGDNLFATGGVRTPLGTVSPFAFLVDQDAAAVQGFRLSSQTYGVRLAGARPLGTAKLAFAASWARQSDWRRNPNRYAAGYRLGEATLSRKAAAGTLGYEVLGADKGVALTSFQTPLASLFRFQGWTNRFSTTPPDGVRDLYATVAGNWTRRGRVSAIALSATAHRFESDRLVRHDGDELDLLASARLGRTTLSARYADYRADRFATDTRKAWLQADWAL